MKVIFLLIFITLPSFANADGLYTGAWSYHVTADDRKRAGKPLNQDHELIAVEYESYYAGHYVNSLNHSTYLLGKYIELYETGYFKFGILAGVTYGYKTCYKPENKSTQSVYCPMFMPEARYTKYKVQPSVFVMQEGAAIALRWDI